MINKIENSSSRQKLPSGTEEVIKKALSTLPKEHLRGIDRVRLVDSINDPRLRNTHKNLTQLPGLYHPRQGAQPAWLEIALDVLLPQKTPVYKRLLPRLSYKANMAAVLFSLVGQHHYLTLRHSVKRGQLESSIRLYTERQLKKWNEKEHTFRARLFKPLQPTFERWARSLQRRAKSGGKTS
jgi:predicted Zn-dependent protease with MMP-like domain